MDTPSNDSGETDDQAGFVAGMRAVLESLPLQAAIIDDHLRVALVNHAWREPLSDAGFSGPGITVGTDYVRACASLASSPGTEPRAVATALVEILNGERSSYEHRYRMQQGSEERTFFLRLARIPTVDARYVLVLHSDVDSMLGYSQEIRTRRMESLGRLTAGVAHDFNNLLTAILGNAHLLARQLPKDDPLQEDVTGVREAARKASVLTRQLLNFARQQPSRPRTVDACSVIREVQHLLRRVLGEAIDLGIEFPPAPLWSEIDGTELQQFLLRIALDVRESMPLGGSLRLTLERETNERREATIALTITCAGAMGGGVADGPVLREPSVAMDELQLLDGSRTEWTRDEAGRTKIAVYLPVAAAAAVGEDTSVGAPRGTETVLVVEDEDLVRRFVRRALEELGYTVLECADPIEAIALAARYKERIHLLLTDVVMPRMNGLQVASQVARLLPDAKILFMSGYNDELALKRIRETVGTAFLQKPFTADVLARKLREMLDS